MSRLLLLGGGRGHTSLRQIQLGVDVAKVIVEGAVGGDAQLGGFGGEAEDGVDVGLLLGGRGFGPVLAQLRRGASLLGSCNTVWSLS